MPSAAARSAGCDRSSSCHASCTHTTSASIGAQVGLDRRAGAPPRARRHTFHVAMRMRVSMSGPYPGPTSRVHHHARSGAPARAHLVDDMPANAVREARGRRQATNEVRHEHLAVGGGVDAPSLTVDVYAGASVALERARRSEPQPPAAPSIARHAFASVTATTGTDANTDTSIVECRDDVGVDADHDVRGELTNRVTQRGTRRPRWRRPTTSGRRGVRPRARVERRGSSRPAGRRSARGHRRRGRACAGAPLPTPSRRRCRRATPATVRLRRSRRPTPPAPGRFARRAHRFTTRGILCGGPCRSNACCSTSSTTGRTPSRASTASSTRPWSPSARRAYPTRELQPVDLAGRPHHLEQPRGGLGDVFDRGPHVDGQHRSSVHDHLVALAAERPDAPVRTTARAGLAREAHEVVGAVAHERRHEVHERGRHQFTRAPSPTGSSVSGSSTSMKAVSSQT